MSKNININFLLIPIYVLATVIIIYFTYKMIKKIIEIINANNIMANIENKPLLYKQFVITC